jgi:hypothetical protein
LCVGARTRLRRAALNMAKVVWLVVFEKVRKRVEFAAKLCRKLSWD